MSTVWESHELLSSRSNCRAEVWLSGPPRYLRFDHTSNNGVIRSYWSTQFISALSGWGEFPEASNAKRAISTGRLKRHLHRVRSCISRNRREKNYSGARRSPSHGPTGLNERVRFRGLESIFERLPQSTAPKLYYCTADLSNPSS